MFMFMNWNGELVYRLTACFRFKNQNNWSIDLDLTMI